MVARFKDSKALASFIRVRSRGKREPKAGTLPPQRESALLRQCLDYLKLKKVLAWRANSGGGLRGGRPVVGNPAGTPDLLIVLPPDGHLVGAELKSASGKLSPAQVAWRAHAEAVGVTYLVVRDVRELIAFVERRA